MSNSSSNNKTPRKKPVLLSNLLMGLFDYKYSHQELRDRVTKVLKTHILLSNTMELRKFHVSLFKKGFVFYWESEKGREIERYHSIYISGDNITGTFISGFHQITSILEFIHIVNNTSP